MTSLTRFARAARQQIFSCKRTLCYVNGLSTFPSLKNESIFQSIKNQSISPLTNTFRQIYTSFPVRSGEFQSSSKTGVTPPPVIIDPDKPHFVHVQAKSHEDLDGIYLVPHFRHSGEIMHDGSESNIRLPHPGTCLCCCWIVHKAI